MTALTTQNNNSKAASTTGDITLQLVTFRLVEEDFGVPILDVREIILMTDITPVPRAPEFVEGVINLRGQIIPIADLRKRFNLGESQRDAQSRIVVVEVENHVLGLIVDAVSEVLRISSSKISAPPALVASGIGAEYIKGIANEDGKLTVLIDLRKVFSGEEMKSLQSI